MSSVFLNQEGAFSEEVKAGQVGRNRKQLQSLRLALSSLCYLGHSVVSRTDKFIPVVQTNVPFCSLTQFGALSQPPSVKKVTFDISESDFSSTVDVPDQTGTR